MGDAAGDALIRDVGQALTASLRSYDLVVRYGGGEFLCAAPGLTIADAETRLAGASAALAHLPSGGSLTVGFADLRPGDTVEGLIGRADADLYQQRKRGAAS